jgi:hypothetical protein
MNINAGGYMNELLPPTDILIVTVLFAFGLTVFWQMVIVENDFSGFNKFFYTVLSVFLGSFVLGGTAIAIDNIGLALFAGIVFFFSLCLLSLASIIGIAGTIYMIFDFFGDLVREFMRKLHKQKGADDDR